MLGFAACGGGGDKALTLTGKAPGRPGSSSTTGPGSPASTEAGRSAGGAGSESQTTSDGSPASGGAGGATSTAGDSPLRRHDVPPGGVEAQSHFGELTSVPPAFFVDCPTAGSPKVTPRLPTITTGREMDICIGGFDTTSDVVVQAVLPNGAPRERRLRSLPGQDQWAFGVGPSDPVGDYALTATQGALSATSSFSVRRPTTEVQTSPPDHGPPGTTFHFVILASRASQTVVLDLYRGNTATDYATALGSVAADGQGRATFDLPTVRDDPAGPYCVVPRGASKCASFVVG